MNDEYGYHSKVEDENNKTIEEFIRLICSSLLSFFLFE
jgi:hypothetical protein